jgi:hypothetical protein
VRVREALAAKEEHIIVVERREMEAGVHAGVTQREQQAQISTLQKDYIRCVWCRLHGGAGKSLMGRKPRGRSFRVGEW